MLLLREFLEIQSLDGTEECHFFGTIFSFDKFGTTYFPYLTKLLTKTEESLLISHMLRQSVALHYPLMCQPEPGRPEICPTQHTS